MMVKGILGIPESHDHSGEGFSVVRNVSLSVMQSDLYVGID